MAAEIAAPDGTFWVVRRNVWPWEPRRRWWGRRAGREVGDGAGQLMAESGFNVASYVPDLFDEFLVAATIFVVAIIAFFAFAWAVPFLVLAVEVIVLVLVAALATAWRLAFRRPWRVTARSDSGRIHRWEVVGWNRSRWTVDVVAEILQVGGAPPDQEMVEALLG